MINLLPYHQKRKVADEIRWRLLVSIFSMLALLGLMLSATLYALNFVSAELISAERDRISRIEDEMSTAVFREGQIRSFNETISELISIHVGSADMTDLFRSLHDALPPGSRIDSVRYDRSIDDSGEVVHQMMVSGYAPEWQSMLEIERGLEERFDEITFSPGVWTRLSDIDFSITLILR